MKIVRMESRSLLDYLHILGHPKYLWNAADRLGFIDEKLPSNWVDLTPDGKECKSWKS